MNRQIRDRLQSEIAPLFVLTVLAIPVIAALAWGRLGVREGRTPPSDSARMKPLAETSLGGRPIALGDADRAGLMRLLWDSLEALKASEPLPASEGLPEACRRPVNSAVFVTLYAPGRQALKAMAREPSLAQSTRTAARRLFEHPGFRGRGFHRSDRLRARFDIVTEEQPLPVLQREQVALLELAAPVGVALWREGEPHAFLPADIADYRAGDHLDILERLCQEAGPPPVDWREEKHYMTLLRSQSFVSARAGSTRCLELVRGLPLLREVGLAQARRSCRLAAQYLSGQQRPDGWFPGSYDAATGTTSRPASLRIQARAAAALARFCARRQQTDEESLATCRRALVPLLERVRASSAGPNIAFVPAEGEPSGAPSVGDSAAVLGAFCEYRCASGDEAWDDLIERLGNWLLLLQGQDGAFRTKRESAAGEAEERPAVEGSVQAEAALGLARAYEALRRPGFLLGARRALDYLSGSEGALDNADAACLFVAAVRKLSSILPTDQYMPAVRQALDRMMESQLSKEEAPAPDLVGAALGGFPPPVGLTAAELEAFAAGWLLSRLRPDQESAQLKDRAGRAALNAARYVVQFQFLPENSYYLANPAAALGGFRQRPGSNVVTLQSVRCALDGLGVLEQAITLEMRAGGDSKSPH